MRARPGRNGVGLVYDRSVVEHEGGDLVVAGELLDRAAALEQPVGAVAAVGPDHLGIVARGDQRLVRASAGVALGRAERSVADVELHLVLLPVAATPARTSPGSRPNARSGTPRGSATRSSASPF